MVITIIMIIVKRFKDEERLKQLGLPLLVYGRRKTGKTFLIKQFFNKATYFFVRRDKTIYYEKRGENITYDELIRIIEENKGVIIIDEFHRLPRSFIDYLHIKAPKNLILVTSTLNLARNLIQNRSPLLGLFLEFKLDLISESDILINLSKRLKGKELIETAVYLREPLMLSFFKGELWPIMNALKLTVPVLIGEVFIEEQKELSERYEGILRAISLGKNTLSEIVNYLFSYKLIKKQDSSMVKQYLKNLTDLGLVRRIKDYYKNRYYYFVISPMIELYYYLDEKYNFSEVNLDEKYFKEKLTKHVESFFRDLLADLFKKRSFIISKPEQEIDIALADFKKLKVIAEVKWKSHINKQELKKIEEKFEEFDCKKILIVPDKKIIKRKLKNIEVWDVNNILKLVRSKYIKG